MNGPFTGVLLAGGRSRRMGCDKALLRLDGKPLLEWQAEKLRALGAGEVLVSGQARAGFSGLRFVPDIYPDRGPVGGLHACFLAAAYPRCLVLSVDTPLVPESALRALLDAHTGGAALLRHAGGIEPLIGVYDSSLAAAAQRLLQSGHAPVKALLDTCPVTCVDYTGPAGLLCNCNTPEEFARAQAFLHP